MADTNQNEEAMTKAAYAYEAKYPRKEWPARRHGFAEGARWRAALAAPEPQGVGIAWASSSPDFEEFMRLAHEVWPFTGTPADRLRAVAFTAARTAFEDSVGWSYTTPSKFQSAIAQPEGGSDAE